MLSQSALFYCHLLVFIAFDALADSTSENSNTNNQSIIKLGSSNALNSPASNLGKEITKGANAYFGRLNSQDGIHGRPVELVSLDDGYEPSNTVINTKKLIKEQVLALFGYVGTPTAHAIMPMLTKSNIPFLMPFTGADFLRAPKHQNIVNLRASYYQEIEAQIKYLLSDRGVKKLALIIQADEFGLAAQRAISDILKREQVEATLTARYRRNTNDIEGAFLKLSAQPIDAVIFVGTHEPFNRLINLAHQKQFNTLFTGLSFIGGHNLLDKVPKSSKVLLSNVVPNPYECQWKLCQDFITDMKNSGYDSLNRVQLEGYLNAFVFSQVAKLCEKKLTRKCLLSQFKTFSYQDNTLQINFNSENNQGLQQVYFDFSKAMQAK